LPERMATAEEGRSSFLQLSHTAEALHRASEDGHGVLSEGRQWIRREGWLLKEAGVVGTWHPRYFAIAKEEGRDTLQYYKEETVKLMCKPQQPLGLELDARNVVTIASGQKSLLEGDLVIGLNGEPIIGQALLPLVESVRAEAGSSTTTVSLTVLRRKATVNLKGSSVTAGGSRKQGGHFFTVSPASDSAARRARYVLVCTDEQASVFWSIAIKEAIAAAAMTGIKDAISEALQLQLLAAASADGSVVPSDDPAGSRPVAYLHEEQPVLPRHLAPVA